VSNIEQYRGGYGGNTISRRAGRTIARMDDGVSVRLARLQNEAEIQADKVAAVSYVGTRAMQSAAMLSQMEQQLAQTVPIATTRLEGLANITAAAMAELVVDTAHIVRRI